MSTTTTGGSVVRAALQKLGVLAGAETPSANDARDSLAEINRMIDGWGVLRLTMAYQLRTVKQLSTGQAIYSIGNGGSINIPRPAWIDRAGLIINFDADESAQTEKPIAVFTDQEWAGVRIKALPSGLIQGVHFDRFFTPGGGLGQIQVYPVPNGSNVTAIVLYTPVATERFTDLTTEHQLAPGYEEAVIYNAAMRLASTFGKPISQEVADIARESKANLMAGNFRPNALQFDLSIQDAPYGTYDIFTNTWVGR